VDRGEHFAIGSGCLGEPASLMQAVGVAEHIIVHRAISAAILIAQGHAFTAWSAPSS